MNKIIATLALFLLHAGRAFSQEPNRGITEDENQAEKTGTNYALVVGISSYANINHLRYADDDAYLFSEYLVNQKICEKKNVARLIDSFATTPNFYKELTRLKNKIQPFDRVFIYFAGHGDVETDLESGFLLTYNSESNNYPATAIDISMVEKYVNAFINKKANVVLITDACRSGNLAGGLSGVSNTMTSISKGFQNSIKILSCQPTQLSLEKDYPGGGHGVFTYHLVDGLKGMADSDGDSAISLREIGLYLDVVRTETNKKQIPRIDGNPEKNVANFDRLILTALLENKKGQTSIASNQVKKSRQAGDSTWTSNPYFQKFDIQIRKSNFTLPQGDNALLTITEAGKNNQPAELIGYMKLELSAILEDEVQKWINKYLRGELEVQTAVVRNEIKKVITYLETIESLAGENDLRFKEIHAKKIFFNAFYVYTMKDKASYENTMRELEKADQLMPNQAWILYLIGILNVEMRKQTESEAAFKKAIKLAPSWSYPWNGLGTLYFTLKNYDQAEAAYKKASEVDSNLVYPWYNLGLLYFELKKYPEAEASYKKAILIDPDYAQPMFNLARLYYRLKNYPEAEATYKKGIQKDSTMAYPWSNLGNIYSDQKKFTDAEAAYKRSAQIDPNFRSAWYNLGNLYSDFDKYPEAEAAYKKAISIDPGYAASYFNLATVYAKWAKLEAALEYLELSFKKGVDDFSSFESDKDWENIRDAPGFKNLIEKYKK